MHPMLVIGTGGTGKWVVTYVKHALIDRRNRELLREHGLAARSHADWDRLPPSVRLLAFDVDAAAKTSVRDARSGGMELSASEFTGFGAAYEKTLATFQDGEGELHYPEIAHWLSRDDARCYDLRALAGSALDGAGQMRQIGRLSLWLELSRSGISLAIDQACRELRQHVTEATKLSIFVVGSVAGGTGSGTFIDFAAIARHHAQRVFEQSHQLIGFVVLPTTFNTVISDSVERSRMAGNSYAALRELLRLNAYPSGMSMRFSQHLDVRLDKSLLTVSYLVEGSRGGAGPDLSSTRPELGIDPAIADVIALHAEHYVDYSQVSAGLMGRADAAYSTIGTVSYIAPIEDVVHEFGKRLARVGLDRLAWGLSTSDNPRLRDAAQKRAATVAHEAVGALLNQPSSERPQLMAWIDQVLGSQRVQQLTTAAHLQYLRNVTTPAESPNLPPTDLRGRVKIAPVGKKGDPPRVKQAAERLMIDVRGGTDDVFTGKPGRGQSAGAVVALYGARNDEMFATYLANRSLALLNEGQGDAASAVPGGLASAAEMLKSLGMVLSEFVVKLSDAYREQQTVTAGGQRRTRLDLAVEARDAAEADMLRDEGAVRDRLNNHAEQETYLERCKDVLDLQIQDDIHTAMVDAVGRCRGIAADLLREVEGWMQTFSDDLTTLGDDIADHVRQRREMAQVPIRKYVTGPEDGVEAALWREQLHIEEGDDAAASPTAAELTKPMSWAWIEGGRPSLRIYGPFGTSGRDVGYWNESGRAAYEELATERFATLRSLTIWDLLERARRKPKEVAQDLMTRSGPLTAYDNELQGRAPAVDVDVRMYALGRWTQAGSDDLGNGSAAISAGVEEALKAQRLTCDVVSWADPHVLTVVQIAHYVKMSALSCRPGLKKEYERLAAGVVEVENTTGKTPMHILSGERAAAELELKSDRLIQTQVELMPSMVSRLESREDIVLFGRGMLTEAVREKRSSGGDIVWVVDVQLDGDEDKHEVSLGEDLIEVCDRFCHPHTEAQQAARETIVAAADRQHEALGDVSYGKQLATAARTAILPKDRRARQETRELDAVLRLLLRERGEFLQGR
jgi:hypothetical protein